jgi:hypothetical protein
LLCFALLRRCTARATCSSCTTSWAPATKSASSAR